MEQYNQYAVTMFIGRHEDISVSSITWFWTTDREPISKMEMANSLRELFREAAKDAGYRHRSTSDYFFHLFNTTCDGSFGLDEIMEDYGFSWTLFDCPLKGWYNFACMNIWVGETPEEEYMFRQSEMRDGQVSDELFSFKALP